MQANPSAPTVIGIMTHYNNVLDGSGLEIFSPTRLQLTLTLTSSELNEPFVIHYPFYFFETPNINMNSANDTWPASTAGCDTALQQSVVPCDDRFTFPANIENLLNESFTYKDVKYTLIIVGFAALGSTGTTPIRHLSTPETKITHAAIYGKLITACFDSGCPSPYQEFNNTACTCQCALEADSCQIALGSNWVLDESACLCVCAQTKACPSGQKWNPETCSCGCTLTNSYCSSISNNSLWGVLPDCTCGCLDSLTLYCANHYGSFWSAQASSCNCACGVSDAKCQTVFGQSYKADSSTCGCTAGGLSNGDIAGIVIGGIAGVLFLLALFSALTAALVKLIRAGKIPGIYGYKLAPQTLDGIAVSPLYSSQWSTCFIDSLGGNSSPCLTIRFNF